LRRYIHYGYDPAFIAGELEDSVTPLAILLERADAALLAHGPSAQAELIRQIERAIGNDDDPDKIRDLDHVLQLVEYRQRPLYPQP
jgi:hypothetical protein